MDGVSEVAVVADDDDAVVAVGTKVDCEFLLLLLQVDYRAEPMKRPLSTFVHVGLIVVELEPERGNGQTLVALLFAPPRGERLLSPLVESFVWRAVDGSPFAVAQTGIGHALLHQYDRECYRWCDLAEQGLWLRQQRVAVPLWV